MAEMRLAVKPVPHYDTATYPHSESQEGGAARRSLGAKLGAAVLAATLGLTLSGCGESGSGLRHPGPPPVRPDFKTEQDAKKKIEKESKPKTQTEPAKQEPSGQQK